MVRELTPKRLVKYLEKNYGYDCTVEVAKKILGECDEDYDDVFSESELMDVVEKYLFE